MSDMSTLIIPRRMGLNANVDLSIGMKITLKWTSTMSPQRNADGGTSELLRASDAFVNFSPLTTCLLVVRSSRLCYHLNVQVRVARPMLEDRL